MRDRVGAFLQKYKLMSAPAKAGLWFTICGFIQKGISFVTVPIFTRLLTTAQYGTVSVYNSWLSLVSIFCTLNLFYGGFNNGMLDYEDRRDEYVSAVQGLITFITIAWVGVYIVVRPLWNSLFEMNTTLVLVMFAEILATAALSLWSARERYEFKYKRLVLITVANAFFASLLSVFAVWLSDPSRGAEARIMISKMVGDAEAGLYSVAYSAAMILNIMVTAINNSFAPWLYGRLKEKDYKPVAKIANTLFLGVAIILVMLISFAPEAITILAGEKYLEAVLIIPSVASSLYFIFMFQIFANVEFYFKKNKFIAYASMLGAVLNIVLNYFGIMWFGYIAAGYTTLICYILCL